VSATPRSPGPEEIRNYLLRRLTDTARTRFEEAYFADDSLFDRIETEEDRLVSDYVLGHLGQEDKGLFEASLLRTPYYQERVDTTSRLHRRLVRAPGVLPSRREPRSDRPAVARHRRLPDLPLFPPGTGKAIVIVVLGVLLVAALLSAVQLKRDVEALKAARGPQEGTAAGAPASPTSSRILALSIPAGPGPPVVHLESIAAGSLLVIPRTALPPGSTTIQIVLADQQGRVLWESGSLRTPRSAADGDLPVALPAGLPPKGVSILNVRAGEATSLLAVLEAL
jgi:hypothetical protein